MANIEYHKIVNFSRNGDLGISNNVICEIALQAIKDIDGVEIADFQNRLFSKGPIVCKFSKKDEVLLDVYIKIKYGYNVAETCAKVQERIEHDLLYMTEIKPKRIHVTIADMKETKDA